VTAEPRSASAVFGAYNQVLENHGLTPFPDGAFGRVRSHFMRIAKFCHEHKIDPERWIRARHEAVGWRMRLPLKQLASASPAFMAKFMDFGADLQAEAIHQESMVSVADHGWSELRVFSEQLKQALGNDPALCLSAAETAYHPESQWCDGCLHQRTCRVRSR